MVTDIGRDELKQKLDHPRKMILVDALPEEQFQKLHLPGAINIPADQVRRLAAELIPNQNVEVIVYCAGPQCHASNTAANEFNAMGYSNVRTSEASTIGLRLIFQSSGRAISEQ